MNESEQAKDTLRQAQMVLMMFLRSLPVSAQARLKPQVCTAVDTIALAGNSIEDWWK